MAADQFSCSLSIRVTRRSSNTILGPVETRKLSFRSCVISYRLFALAKTDAENCNTYPRLQTDSGRFAFHFCGPWGRHQESYLPVPRLCKEHGQKLEYNCLIYYSCKLWPCVGGTLSRNLNTMCNMTYLRHKLKERIYWPKQLGQGKIQFYLHSTKTYLHFICTQLKYCIGTLWKFEWCWLQSRTKLMLAKSLQICHSYLLLWIFMNFLNVLRI